MYGGAELTSREPTRIPGACLNHIIEGARGRPGRSDELAIPKCATLGIPWEFRMLSRPVEDITRSLDVSMYDEGGISYHLPDNPHAGLSSKW